MTAGELAERQERRPITVARPASAWADMTQRRTRKVCRLAGVPPTSRHREEMLHRSWGGRLIGVFLYQVRPVFLCLGDVALGVLVELLGDRRIEVEIKLSVPDLPRADIHGEQRPQGRAVGAVSPELGNVLLRIGVELRLVSFRREEILRSLIGCR